MTKTGDVLKDGQILESLIGNDTPEQVHPDCDDETPAAHICHVNNFFKANKHLNQLWGILAEIKRLSSYLKMEINCRLHMDVNQ